MPAAGAVDELQGNEFGTEKISCPVLVMHGNRKSTEDAKTGADGGTREG